VRERVRVREREPKKLNLKKKNRNSQQLKQNDKRSLSISHLAFNNKINEIFFNKYN
jgi:hypothetical protein